MAQFIYTMNRVAKVVPPKRIILRDISLSFFPGAKIGVLGLNGSGKSTLLKIMAGIDKDIEGEARPQAGIKVGFLPQEPRSTSQDGAPGGRRRRRRRAGLIDRFNAISDQFAEPMADDEMNKLLEEQAKLQDKIDAVGGWELERKLEIAADALRLPPWDALIGKLSGGEKRRVALCRLLLSKPDMLLLDEPTNHLDAESVAWLEHFLEEYPSTVIAVTHDRYFLDNVAEWILELDRGHGIPWEGNYSSWLEQKEQRLAQEERQQDALGKTLKRELEWVRTNPKARQAKSKARLQRYEELASQEFQKRNETNEIYIPPGDRLGDLVIECSELRKAFGDRLLIDSLELQPAAGGIVGIIGPNGAGKTTLFRMLTGVEKPDAGEIRIGPDRQARLRRSIAPGARRQEHRLAGDLRRPRHHQGRQLRDPLARLRRPLQLQGRAAAAVDRRSVRRRAQSRASGQGAERRRQRAAARRADQRSGHRDAARAGGGAGGFPRLRRGHLARSLVPRPHRDAHPRVRRRFAGRLVRGQLSGIRRGPSSSARARTPRSRIESATNH